MPLVAIDLRKGRPGLRLDDLFVVSHDVGRTNVSFGKGLAQCAA